MTTLILVRHGQIAGGWWSWLLDPLLDSVGVEQARQVAECLTIGEKPAALYTSSLNRAQLTARIIGKPLGLAPIVVPDLREASMPTILGLLGLLTLDRLGLASRLRTAALSRVARLIPGYAALCGRIGRAIDDIVARHPNETVVVVSHGGAIRAALAHLQPAHAKALWSADVECGGVIRVRVHPDRSCHVEFGLDPPEAPGPPRSSSRCRRPSPTD